MYIYNFLDYIYYLYIMCVTFKYCIVLYNINNLLFDNIYFQEA